MSYEFPAVGAFYHESHCLFTVWAPHAENVDLILNDQLIPMIRLGSQYWTVTIDSVAHGASYWFRLDGGKELPDPASQWQPAGVHGPSAVMNPEFTWTDDSWRGISLADMILYELHVGTFSAEGNFDGVTAKLGYLKSLGVNAIELMPIAQFPGNRNWGYDGVYPFAVHHDYGGAIGLKRLVNEAHHFGIAVILDVVYNHQGPEGNYLSAYGPYFTDKYKTGWGKAINFDDAWCDGVRHFYWQNAIMWLDEFHIDGLRLDAVHAIWDNSAKHFIQELAIEVRALERKLGRKKVLVAEFDLNNPRYINAPEKGGYGLDGQWVDEFHHALHALVTGEVDGYYEDFGNVSHLTKSLSHGYVYTGEYSKHRKKLFGDDPVDNAHDQFVVFGQNHDQIGNRMLGDRLTSCVSFEALKLVAGVVLLSPQVPLLFMGEEYGEKNLFQYFISHTDADLIKMVQVGRRKEFSYFNWQGDVPDPQAEETFRQCKLSWQYNEGQQAILLAYYKHLIAFRKNRVVMQGRTRNNATVTEIPEKNVITLMRTFEDDRVLIFFNFEKNPVRFTYPLPQANLIFNSSAPPWIAESETMTQEVIDDKMISMNRESVLIFEI